MLVAAGAVPLNWLVGALTVVLYPPGFFHRSGIWKPETLSAAHGGEVGLTGGFTLSRIAKVPPMSLVAGAVLVASPIVNFFEPEGRLAGAASVAVLPSAAVEAMRAPATAGIAGLKITGRPTSLGENSA